MARKVYQGSTVSFAQKFSRLGSRLREAQWRRYGITLLAGKLLGIFVVFLTSTFLTQLLFTKVYAADAVPLRAC